MTYSLPARALILLCRSYQVLGSGRMSRCRFTPSCSQYAVESLARHGALRGSWLVVRRLSRCHPLGGYGADPIPE